MSNFETSKIAIILLIIMMLPGCESNYDGEYEAEGFWPFRNYRLVLPSFELDENTIQKYTIKKFGTANRHLHINLHMTSDTKIPFEEEGIQLQVRLSNNGNIIWQPHHEVFHHYNRMKFEQTALAPNENEWICRFEWADKNISSRAVPFDVTKPIKKRELTCAAMISNPKTSMLIDVECLECKARGIKAQLKFSSSWK